MGIMLRIISSILFLLLLAASPAAAYEVFLRSGIELVRLPGIPLALETAGGAAALVIREPQGSKVYLCEKGRLKPVDGTRGAESLYRIGERLFFTADATVGQIKGRRIVATWSLAEPRDREWRLVRLYAVPPHGFIVLASADSVDDGLPRPALLHLRPGNEHYPLPICTLRDPADTPVFIPGTTWACVRAIDDGRPSLFYYDYALGGGFRRFDAAVDPRDPEPTADGKTVLYRDAADGDALRVHYLEPNETVALDGMAGIRPAADPWNRRFAWLVPGDRDAELHVGDFIGRSAMLGKPSPGKRRGDSLPPVGRAFRGNTADLFSVMPIRPVFIAPGRLAFLKNDGLEYYLGFVETGDIK